MPGSIRAQQTGLQVDVPSPSISAPRINEEPTSTKWQTVKAQLPGAGLAALIVLATVAEHGAKFGVPALSAVAPVLKEIHAVCAKAQQNKKAFAKLAAGVDRFSVLIVRQHKRAIDQDNELWEEVSGRLLGDLETELRLILDKCTKEAEKKYWARVKSAISQSATEELDDCDQRLHAAIDAFEIESIHMINQRTSVIEKTTKGILQNTAQISQEQTSIGARLMTGQSNISAQVASAVIRLQGEMKTIMDMDLKQRVRDNLGESLDIIVNDNSMKGQNAHENLGIHHERVGTLIGALDPDLVDMTDRLVRATKFPHSAPQGHCLGYLKTTNEASGHAKTKFWLQIIDHKLVHRKVTNEKSLRRIIQEIQHRVNSRDNNIMSIVGYMISSHNLDPYVFIVSEYLDYESLDTYLHLHFDKNPLSMTIQLAKALRYLHEDIALKPSLIHGDVRCGNVFVTSLGKVKLSGFSAAAIITELDQEKAVDMGNRTDTANEVAFYWQCPEVVLKNKKITTMSDVWSFAMTIVECLSITEIRPRTNRQHPFPSMDKPHFKEYVRDGERSGQIALIYTPMPVEEYALKWGTDKVWQLIVDCLKFDPLQRPTIASVHERLEVICKQMKTPNPSPALKMTVG